MRKDISAQLKKAREESGLLQEDVANIIGSTPQKISSFETGRTRVGLDVFMQLCEIYNLNANDLLGLSENKFSSLSKDEQQVMEAYRNADAIDKEIIKRVLKIEIAQNASSLLPASAVNTPHSTPNDSVTVQIAAYNGDGVTTKTISTEDWTKAEVEAEKLRNKHKN